ncbi:50S ribosomal protein L11 [Candidatus Pacearchaeota archaeon]|nr:50S ribosomal protein L11 [Candidatus Pacearchaeota archaeon]
MQIKLLVEGGSMQPGPVLAQKLGPAGINIGKVISSVNDATKEFKGLKVPVELDVDTATKDFDVRVFSPPVSELLKKELGVDKGSGIQGKLQVANASIEQIISIAKQKRQNLLAKDFKSAVKSVLGTCTSLGVLVENKMPKDLAEDIDSGKFDEEINSQKTDTSPEKRKKLDEYFKEVHNKQEKRIELEKAAEEAEEAEAAAAAEGEAKPGADAGAEPGKEAAKPVAAGKEAAKPGAGKAEGASSEKKK